MKEQYVKPTIIFESFSLTQSIAKDCGDEHTGTLGQSTHYDRYTCAWDLGDFTIFLSHCDMALDEDEEIEGFCYNNPEGGQSIFSST